ncbi:unnamed protein product, partial [Symbiodinium natans]
MLSADAKLAQSAGKLSSLMWAHWSGQSEAGLGDLKSPLAQVVLKLTSKGSSLSNADLEGLQLLRAVRDELSDGAEAPGVQLLWPDTSQIWLGCWLPTMPKYLSPSTSTYLHCAKGLLSRMTWGAGQDNGTAMPSTSVGTAPGAAADEEEQQKPSKAAEELLQALRLIGADKGAVASAQLLALRLTAEGKVGLSPANVIALNLFLSDSSFHSEVSAALVSQFSQQPLPAVRERAADIYAAHAQLSAAIQALPARKVVCFRAIRFTGGMRDFLRGHRLGMDCYRPGSIVMWRHAASCTQDPALAEELALHGEPAAACGLVFKIRRAASARPVADFSATPEHQEVLFAAGTIFRVVGFYPCSQQSLRQEAGSASPNLHGYGYADRKYQERHGLGCWALGCGARQVLFVRVRVRDTAFPWLCSAAPARQVAKKHEAKVLMFEGESEESGESDEEGAEEGEGEEADPDPEPLEDLDGAFADARDCWKIDAETLKGFYLHSPTGQLFSWDQARGVLYEYIRQSGECKPIWAAGAPHLSAEIWTVLPLPPTDPASLQNATTEQSSNVLCILHLSRARAAVRAQAASEDFCQRLRLGNCALEALLSLPPAGQAYVLKTFCAPRSDPAGALCRQVEVLRRLGSQAPYASALEHATIRVPTSGAILGRCVPEVAALCWHDTDPVAAAHCRISCVGGQFSVCDLGADEEGTLFDGRRLGTAWCPLEDGCKLDMGPIRVRVELKPVNAAPNQVTKTSSAAKRGSWRSAKRKAADSTDEPAQPKRPRPDLKKVTAPLLREPSPELQPAGLESASQQ